MGSVIHVSRLFLIAMAVSTSHLFLFDDDTQPLRIASFNIRHFGRGVMDKPDVVSHLITIFKRYDLVLVQEVRDGTNTALDDLKNSLTRTTGTQWNYTASEPLGNTKYYREQYVFFFRETAVSPKDTYQVNDTAENLYSREPFAVEFEYMSSSQNVRKRIVLMGLHTSPPVAKLELQSLPKTIEHVAAQFPDSKGGVITLGDLNADCDYLAAKWRRSLQILNGPNFTSLIPDDADTAVKLSVDCAYDRIIVHGDWIDARNATVFKFDEAFHLNEDDALEVSDHFPIEFLLF